MFHGVARYGREVIGRVQVDQAKALREDKVARKVVEISRWLLLRNAENLQAEQQVALHE